MRTRTKLVGGLVAGVVLLAACGNDSDGADGLASNPPEDTTETTGPPGDETSGDATGDAVVQTAETDLGEVLVDADGFTLYGFEPDDASGESTCDDECAEVWPPLTVEGSELPEGLDPDVFSVTERSDGTHQLVAGGWPLYTYTADAEPGDTNGQGVNDFGLWYVVTPDGELNREDPG